MGGYLLSVRCRGYLLFTQERYGFKISMTKKTRIDFFEFLFWLRKLTSLYIQFSVARVFSRVMDRDLRLNLK